VNCCWCGIETKNEKQCEWCGRPPVKASSAPSVPAATPVSPAAAPEARSPEARLLVEPPRRLTAGERWERFLALMTPTLLGSAALIHYAPTTFPVVTLTALFACGLALGGFRLIPSFDDDYLDVGAILTVSLIVGPLPTLIAYLVLCVARQDWGWSMVTILTAWLLIAFALESAFWGAGSGVSQAVRFGFSLTAAVLNPVAIFAGWILSSFFRPLND
jgi:hypothetical protein